MLNPFQNTRSLRRGAAALAAVACATIVAAPVAAQAPPAPVALAVHALHGGVYWVSGGVSNTAFIVGSDGVVVFDPQASADAARQELSDIAKITPKSVNTIIVSHADPDHTGGLLGFPTGLQIIEHENAWTEIEASASDPSAPSRLAPMYKAVVAGYPPTRTIGDTQTVVLDGVRMELIHVAPAHTSGDIAVYLPAQKIVLAADIITTNTGHYAAVHLGGSTLGWIDSMKALLALDADTYLPGHGAIESKAQLRARLHDVEERREQIKMMVMNKKSLAEIEQALPDTDSSPMFETFTQTVYRELTQGYPKAFSPWLNLVHH